jgi:hypothetical protein
MTEPRICGAPSYRGKPCKRWLKPGQELCPMHDPVLIAARKSRLCTFVEGGWRECENKRIPGSEFCPMHDPVLIAARREKAMQGPKDYEPKGVSRHRCRSLMYDDHWHWDRDTGEEVPNAYWARCVLWRGHDGWHSDDAHFHWEGSDALATDDPR